MMQLKLFAFDAEAPIRTKPLFGGRTSAGNRSKGKHLDLQTILKAKGFKLPYLSTVCALGEIITPPMLAAPIAIADPYFEDRYLVISIDRATLNRRLDLKWWDNVAPKHHHFFGLR
jgi:hypothetical protein